MLDFPREHTYAYRVPPSVTPTTPSARITFHNTQNEFTSYLAQLFSSQSDERSLFWIQMIDLSAIHSK